MQRKIGSGPARWNGCAEPRRTQNPRHDVMSRWALRTPRGSRVRHHRARRHLDLLSTGPSDVRRVALNLLSVPLCGEWERPNLAVRRLRAPFSYRRPDRRPTAGVARDHDPPPCCERWSAGEADEPRGRVASPARPAGCRASRPASAPAPGDGVAVPHASLRVAGRPGPDRGPIALPTSRTALFGRC